MKKKVFIYIILTAAAADLFSILRITDTTYQNEDINLFQNPFNVLIFYFGLIIIQTLVNYNSQFCIIRFGKESSHQIYSIIRLMRTSCIYLILYITMNTATIALFKLLSFTERPLTFVINGYFIYLSTMLLNIAAITLFTVFSAAHIRRSVTRIILLSVIGSSLMMCYAAPHTVAKICIFYFCVYPLLDTASILSFALIYLICFSLIFGINLLPKKELILMKGVK